MGDGPAPFSPSALDSPGQPNVNYFRYELTSRFLSAKLEDGSRDGYWSSRGGGSHHRTNSRKSVGEIRS